MKDFLLRTTCLLLLAGLFSGYDIVLAMRGKDEQIAKLQAQAESAAALASSESSESSGSGYRDGTYTASAEGYGGPICLEVVIKEGSIDEIQVISAAKEDAAYWNMAKQLIPRIKEEQTADIDTVSGATYSSVGILNAAADALNQALE